MLSFLNVKKHFKCDNLWRFANRLQVADHFFTTPRTRLMKLNFFSSCRPINWKVYVRWRKMSFMGHELGKMCHNFMTRQTLKEVLPLLHGCCVSQEINFLRCFHPHLMFFRFHTTCSINWKTICVHHVKTVDVVLMMEVEGEDGRFRVEKVFAFHLSNQLAPRRVHGFH